MTVESTPEMEAWVMSTELRHHLPGIEPTFTPVAVHMEGGSYWAEVVELPGCFAAGDTFGELQESLQEAIGLYLDIKVGRLKLEPFSNARG